MDLFKKWSVTLSSTDDDVRQAYRVRVQKMHPDRIGNTKENQDAFCQLQEEYTLLKTEAKRQSYWNELQVLKQAKLEESLRQQETIYPQDASLDQGIRVVDRAVVPPSALKVAVAIPLTLASAGGRVQIIVPYSKPCVCGRKISCRLCKGTGQVWENKKVRVSFEGGLEENASLLVKGSGHQGTFENGDLYVTLKWEKTFGWIWNKKAARLEKRFILPPPLVNSGSLAVMMPSGVLKTISFKETAKSSSSDKTYLWVETSDGFKKAFVIIKPSWLGWKDLLSQFALRTKAYFPAKKSKDKGE